MAACDRCELVCFTTDVLGCSRISVARAAFFLSFRRPTSSQAAHASHDRWRRPSAAPAAAARARAPPSATADPTRRRRDCTGRPGCTPRARGVALRPVAQALLGIGRPLLVNLPRVALGEVRLEGHAAVDVDQRLVVIVVFPAQPLVRGPALLPLMGTKVYKSTVNIILTVNILCTKVSHNRARANASPSRRSLSARHRSCRTA